MDEFLEMIYLEQVMQECNACLIAIDRLNGGLHTGNPNAIFGGAMEFVHHAAAVSRIFWPPKSRTPESTSRSRLRGEALRSALGIKADHPVQSRTLRDHFEHFDERLDDWAERSQYRNIVKTFVGQRDAISGNAIEDGDIIHHFDPVTNVYAFRGEKFDLQQLVRGIEDIRVRTSSKLAEIEQLRRDRRRTK